MKITEEFEYIGKRLFNEGLVGGNFGNMSVRTEGGFYITKSGSYLDECEEVKFVSDDGVPEAGASSEWRVHYAVYRQRPDVLAIVHAHPAYAVAVSFDRDCIVTKDSEGKMLCPRIPVATGEPGTEELARNVAAALSNSNAAVARGHGTFTVGKNLKDAYLMTSIAEHASKIVYLTGDHPLHP